MPPISKPFAKVVREKFCSRAKAGLKMSSGSNPKLKIEGQVENLNGMYNFEFVPRVDKSKQPVSLQIPFDNVIEVNLQFCNAYDDGSCIYRTTKLHYSII